MLLQYELTVDDLVAFNRYHCAQSPSVRRTKYAAMFVVAMMLIAASYLIPATADVSRGVIFALAIGFAGLFAVIFNVTYPASMDRAIRRMCREGANKGLVGRHELEIDAEGLIERTEFNETRQSWRGVERIGETDDYAFIYISAIMAHVIPRQTVIAGDPDAFIARAKQLWQAQVSGPPE